MVDGTIYSVFPEEQRIFSTSICAVKPGKGKVWKNNTVNILIGPLQISAATEKMMSAFFLKKADTHIYGGTSASVAAAYLKMSMHLLNMRIRIYLRSLL